MADVVRQDVVRLDLEVSDTFKELKKISSEIDELKKLLKGGIGDDEFDELKDSAKKTKQPIEDTRKSTNKLKEAVVDLGKKAATVGFNGLKKMAGVSFKALGVGLAGAATGIGAIVKQSVDAFSEFEQLKGGVETLFGTNGAKSVEEYASLTGKSVDDVKTKFAELEKAQELVLTNANNAYKTSGLSANAYMETVTSFSASLINSVKGDTKLAAEMADSAIVDMSDNANKMGTDISLIQNAYQGFAKGNYTMLDNLKLGFGGTKTEMERLVNEAAKLDKSVKANDMSFGNITKAIHAHQVEMSMSGITYKEYLELVKSGKKTEEEAFKLLGTTAKEANFTVKGSLEQTKAAWGNMLTAIGSGENMDQCFNNLLESVEIFGKNIIPVAERSLEGIGVVVEKLAPKIEENLPKVIKTLLPPLLSAASSLLSGLIRALPGIAKTVIKEIPNVAGQLGNAIIEGITGKEVSGKALAGFAKMFGGISVGLLALIPTMKGFKAFQNVKSLFSKATALGGEDGSPLGGEKGGIFSVFENLAKTKTTTVLKGMANLAIILGGFAALAAAFTFVAPHIAKLGDLKSVLELSATMGVLGVLGSVLTKFASTAGMIPITTVLKGLANIAIVIGGTALLTLLTGFATMIPLDTAKVLKFSLCMGVLGTLGSVLAGFAGIVGMIPIPVVLSGLANIGLVLGGFTGLILAFSELSKVEGFNSFIESGGEVLAKITNTVGKIAGSLIGGIGEGVTASLPAMGEHIAGFAKSLEPMFTMFKGADMGGVGSFFSALGGFVLKLSGGKILDFFSGGADFSGVAKGLGQLADGEGTKKFFTMVNALPEEAFGKGKKLFDCLDGISSLPNTGGIGQVFSGENDYGGVAKGLEQLAGEGVKKFFTMVQGLNEVAFGNGKEFFKCLDGISALPNTGGIGQLFSGKNDYSGVAEGLGQLAADGVKKFFTMVQGLKEAAFTNTKKFWGIIKDAGTVANVNLGGLETKGKALSGFMKEVNGAFKTDIGKVVDTSISDIVKKISKLPKQMADAVRNNGSVLADAFVKIWKDTVNAVKTPVNKLISGANWVLKEFGSKKTVASWTPYAKGTDGHKGGNALVNDGRGAELVQMPNGQAFIPQGRNVLLPNAPKGMKVLPAEQTAQLMGKKSPTYHYAKGTGKFDIWQYMDEPSGLGPAIKNNFVDYNGLSGLALHIGQGMVNTISGQMTDWAKKLYDEFGIGKGWKWPSAARGINSYYGRRTAPKKGASTNHGGIDIDASWGTPVFASKGGRVTIAGPWGGYGNLVEIDHGQGWTTRYGHNSSLLVSVGQRVRQGQTIALVGSTGISTGPHIHFEIRRNGLTVNPLSYLDKFANGGIATKPSLFGDDGAEMAIPLKKEKRKRAIDLWKYTGNVLGYTPENSTIGSIGSVQTTENNSYAPVFNFYVNGNVDDMPTRRKLKKAVKEAVDEVFESMGRKNPSVQVY
jgi:phage-related protein/ElaB/YqjD/DUF883 family membrane-anchored ribosome-binding protein